MSRWHCIISALIELYDKHLVTVHHFTSYSFKVAISFRELFFCMLTYWFWRISFCRVFCSINVFYFSHISQCWGIAAGWMLPVTDLKMTQWFKYILPYTGIIPEERQCVVFQLINISVMWCRWKRHLMMNQEFFLSI